MQRVGSLEVRPSRARLAAVFCLTISVVSGVGCGREEQSTPNVEPFPGSASSLRALGELVLDGFARGDTVTLARLRLTAEAHRDVVWPEITTAQGSGLPQDLAWSDLERRNARAVARNLAWFASRSVAFEDVHCEGVSREFPTFRVLTDCWIRFRIEGGGLGEAALFEEVVARGKGYKVFRYSDGGVRALGSST
ncbi:MAG: hypothetical protein R3E10_07460 [Gemmatimonadota bacterium]